MSFLILECHLMLFKVYQSVQGFGEYFLTETFLKHLTV